MGEEGEEALMTGRKQSLRDLIRSQPLDEIDDILADEEKPCRSTRTDVRKDTSGTKYARTVAQKKRDAQRAKARARKASLPE